jgi:L-lactate dehydrogenase
MKVGIGFVGTTAGYALVMSGVGRELVLVDKNPARAEADDRRHAMPFACTCCGATPPSSPRSCRRCSPAPPRIVIAPGQSRGPGPHTRGCWAVAVILHKR